VSSSLDLLVALPQAPPEWPPSGVELSITLDIFIFFVWAQFLNFPQIRTLHHHQRTLHYEHLHYQNNNTTMQRGLLMYRSSSCCGVASGLLHWCTTAVDLLLGLPPLE
jgi:hypothetical protein